MKLSNTKRKRAKLRRLWWKLSSLPHDWWYWIKCRLWHRYNVVVCRPLPPTWCDRDYLLLFAAFQILEDFIVKEEGHYHEDVYTLYLDCGEERAREEERDWNEIRVLYAWWQERKDCKYNDDYDKDNEMLHRLINVRKYLWT